MAGRSHTTRTPHRMNDALNRGPLGLIARQNVANADFRKAIYVRPHGKGFHWVRNPTSGEEYVVSDGLGGATVAPGSTVGLLSYHGMPGETLATRAPAGFGGSSTSSVDRTPRSNPIADPGAPDPTVDPDILTILGFCWDHEHNVAIIARRREVVDPPSVAVEFVKISRSVIPHLDASLGTAFCSVADCSILAMQYGESGGFFVLRSDGPGTVANTINFIVTAINNSGTVVAEVNYDGNDSYPVTSTLFVDGYLYATEPKAGAEPGGGPPFDPWARITKRDQSTLSVVNSYDIPSPSSFDGWTLRNTNIECIVDNGGTVRAYISHQKQPPGGSDAKLTYQDFDSALATSGGEVQFPDNPLGGLGDNPFCSGNQVKNGFSSGYIVFAGAGLTSLNTRAIDGSGFSEILAAYNPSGGDNFGIAVISSDEVLVVGNGNVFTTSIISAAGQELP